jgi:uncharacterized surface protein with fasciclin (FAS1) repeats
MKYPFSFLFTVFCLATTRTTVTTAQTMLDVLIASPDHTVLTGAFSAADPAFAEFLSWPDITYTLFAPDNAAFSTIDPEYIQLLYTSPWAGHCKCVAVVCIEFTVSTVSRVY